MPLYPIYTESPYAGTEGKVLLADRAYMAPFGTIAPTAAAAGEVPAGGWEDLGSIDKSAVTIDKADATTIPVETGLYQVLRAEVATKDGDATATFTMVEYEPDTWAKLTGDTTHTIGTVGPGQGKGIWLGGRPIIQKALLLVGQNPVTGSEFQHYSPTVNLTYKVVDVDQFKGIQVTCKFLKFVDATDTTRIARDYELIMYPGDLVITP